VSNTEEMKNHNITRQNTEDYCFLIIIVEYGDYLLGLNEDIASILEIARILIIDSGGRGLSIAI